MNPTDFNTRYTSLLERFHNAYRLQCYRTARARLHDLANLQHSISPSSAIEGIYRELLRKYDTSDKISNIR